MVLGGRHGPMTRRCRQSRTMESALHCRGRAESISRASVELRALPARRVASPRHAFGPASDRQRRRIERNLPRRSHSSGWSGSRDPSASCAAAGDDGPSPSVAGGSRRPTSGGPSTGPNYLGRGLHPADPELGGLAIAIETLSEVRVCPSRWTSIARASQDGVEVAA